MNEILCKRCGKALAEDDRGRYYAHICKDCCDKDGLCPDCGHPVILTQEQMKSGFACSGWHTAGITHLIDIGTVMKDTICPECGHKFKV